MNCRRYLVDAVDLTQFPESLGRVVSELERLVQLV